MPLTDQDKKTTFSIVELGLFLETVTVMLSFCVRFNKSETLKRVKEIVDSFPDTLSESEKVEYQKQGDRMIQKKGEKLLEELKKEFTPEEIKEMLPQLLQK